MDNIDLNPDYLINGSLNNQLSKNTDDKPRKLNSVAIICTCCYTLETATTNLDCYCYYCNLNFHIRNIVIERKHQNLFEIMTCSNCSYITTEEVYNLRAIKCPDIFDL